MKLEKTTARQLRFTLRRRKTFTQDQINLLLCIANLVPGPLELTLSIS